MPTIVPQDKGSHLFGRPLGLTLLVLYKGVWGAIETCAGVFVMFSYRIFSGELTEDPQDLFARWLFSHLGVAQAHRIGLVIFLLGITKVAIALGVWHRSWLMRNIALVFLSGGAIIGIYAIALLFTPFRLGALIVDVFFLYYFWKVLPKHLHHGEIV